MKIGRNQPCICGSTKKYKHCHYGKPFSPERDLLLYPRNLMLLRAAEDIFGFSKGRSWADFKKNISGEQIRQFYEVKAGVWPPDIDWPAIMPEPNAELRALYLGDIRPELILKNIVRFSLYSDQIFVVDPFHNPWITKPEFNPIENPDQYKADTIKLIYFLFSIAPWIESGIVQLLPEPGDFNLALKRETWNLARTRIGKRELDKDDLEEAYAVGREELKRVLFALPEDKFFHALEKSGQKLSDKRKKDLLAYARQALQDDPVAWEQSIADNYQQGQLLATRAGANLETALLICGQTGAFPYTNINSRWQEIMSAREELGETARVWSPLTKAFQTLEFKFLNDVDTAFAQNVREDGRLNSFRSLLRKIGKDAGEIKDLGSLDSYVRDCKDELIGEYQKAQVEWDKINESFLKWAGTGIAGSFATGHMFPSLSSLSIASMSTIAQLATRYFKQQQFRKINPMSVFIDLSNRPQPESVTLI